MVKRIPLILASQSPRRASILRQVGLDFIINQSTFIEKKEVKIPTIRTVKKLVIDNAQGKAQNVATKIKNGIIIGSDTLVFYEKAILGKPKDKKDALDMLSVLQGKTHTVLSGLALVHKENNKIIAVVTGYEKTKVVMRKSTKEELQKYVETGEPLDKAGSYGIQEKGAIFVERMEGDYYTVVGFPLPMFITLLKKLNFSFFDFL